MGRDIFHYIRLLKMGNKRSWSSLKCCATPLHADHSFLQELEVNLQLMGSLKARLHDSQLRA